MKKARIKSGQVLLAGIIFSFLLQLQSCQVSQEVENISKTAFDTVYEATIDSLINLMTLEEKVHMVHGDGMFVSGGCERLGIPEIRYTDGPTGIREEMERDSWKPLELTTDSVTFFPSGTALAATWSEELAYRYGIAIGSEANARGKHVLLGPGTNIIRTPLCGRNFEYFSEDPLLNSRIAVGYVKGVQEMDVAACVKHYTLNNQEHERGSISVEIDERTLREIYLPVYKATALEAEAYSFMASYNKVRGQWMSENKYLNNEVLKGEYGYKGAIISDWGGTHSTVDAALNGLDVEMGGRLENMHFAHLADSVRAGMVPESVIDDKVRRILRLAFNCKLMEPGRKTGEANTPENSQLAYDVAAESIVLLKNEDDLLPLDIEEYERIVVIGANATHIQAAGGYTAGVKAKYEITPLAGIRDRMSEETEIIFAQGYTEDMIEEDIEGDDHHKKIYPNSKPDPKLMKEAVAEAKKADVAIIIAGNTRMVESEGRDRVNMDLPFGQDALIKAVSEVNENTIVVVVAGAPCNLNVANKHSQALLYAWFNGSEAGNALADVLIGEVVPSGKLPFTIPKKLDDIACHALNAYPGENGSVEYKEGILVGYRWFDTKDIEPRFPYGFGMSYTEFDYSNLEAEEEIVTVNDNLEFSFVVENVGNYDGKETAQVYVQALNSKMERAQKELKLFRKVELFLGEAQELEFVLDIDDLAYYDVAQSKWVVEPGKYKLLVGGSSRDIREELEFEVTMSPE